MARINENFLMLENDYLFANVLKRKEEYQKKYPHTKIINMGVGDVTLPIVPCVIKAMKQATDEMANSTTFKGYGPVQGYSFLKEKIIQVDYQARGVCFDETELFISDGSKCDLGNIIELFATDNRVGIVDPVYPVYRDTNLMAGRKGIHYLPATEENDFKPQIPKEKLDIIYLCYPNNPTGTVLTKEELEQWVAYAKENKTILLFDSVYEAFITDKTIPHSIYEIEGAKEVAIEFRSMSKLAGFTGIRCSYLVIPKELKLTTQEGKEVSFNSLWNRRQTTKFGGVSYITQRAAEAVYTKEGQKQIRQNISYYLENARYLKTQLEKIGFLVYGGSNSPYLWVKIPEGEKSWDFFDRLLNETGVIGTPGVGFGKWGEGFFRFTAFGRKEDIEEAIKRIQSRS